MCLLGKNRRQIRHYQVLSHRVISSMTTSHTTLYSRFQLQFYERSNWTDLTFLSGGPGRRAPTSLGMRRWCGLPCAPRQLLAITAAAGRPSVSVRNFFFDQLRFHLQLRTQITPEVKHYQSLSMQLGQKNKKYVYNLRENTCLKSSVPGHIDRLNCWLFKNVISVTNFNRFAFQQQFMLKGLERCMRGLFQASMAPSLGGC